MFKFNVGDLVTSLDRRFDRLAGWPHGVVRRIYGSLYYVSFDHEHEQWAHSEEELEPRVSRARTLPEGSAERKQYPLFTGPMLYFPAALAAVAKLCKDGNDKHNPGEPMHHARSKSSDHEDCIARHLLDAREGDGRDERGVPHVVMLAWRALAHAQEWLERHDGAPKAPAARD